MLQFRPEPRGNPKNKWGLSSTAILQARTREMIRRQRAEEERTRAAREEAADARQAARLTRRHLTADAMRRRLDRLERFPGVQAATQLARLANDPEVKEEFRVRAAKLILRMGDPAD